MSLRMFWEVALFRLEKRLQEFHYTVFEIKKFLSLTSTCLSQTIFSFQCNFCKQFKSLALHSPLSPILADIYIHYFENTPFKMVSLSNGESPFDNDDTFTLIDISLHKVDNISQIMNSIDNNNQVYIWNWKQWYSPFSKHTCLLHWMRVFHFLSIAKNC